LPHPLPCVNRRRDVRRTFCTQPDVLFKLAI
jgi:hypothetical protein